MAELSEMTRADEALPDEIIRYKPISPSATLGLIVGLTAVVAAIITPDIGWAFLAVPILGLVIGVRAMGSIRRYDMAGKGAARAAIALSAMALGGGTAHHIIYLKTAVPPGYAAISYETLQPKGGEPIPSVAQGLNGKKVYIRGYVFPTENKKSFVLCRDNATCCFGGQPKLTDMVEVKLKDPLRIHHTSSERGVGGTLRVAPEKAGSLGTVLYHIDDADVLH